MKFNGLLYKLCALTVASVSIGAIVAILVATNPHEPAPTMAGIVLRDGGPTTNQTSTNLDNGLGDWRSDTNSESGQYYATNSRIVRIGDKYRVEFNVQTNGEPKWIGMFVGEPTFDSLPMAQFKLRQAVTVDKQVSDSLHHAFKSLADDFNIKPQTNAPVATTTTNITFETSTPQLHLYNRNIVDDGPITFTKPKKDDPTTEWLPKSVNAGMLIRVPGEPGFTNRFVQIGLRSDGVLVWRETKP